MVCMWFVPRKYVFETNRFIFIFSLLVLAWEPLLSQQQLQCPLLWAVRHLGHWVTPSGFKWEILMVCSYAYHKAGSNNNNKVCLSFPASHFSCRKSLQHIIKIIQSLALLLEGRQHSARAAGSSVRRCQTAKHHASQDAECAPSLGLEAVEGKRAALCCVHDVWMVPACPSFSTGGNSTFCDTRFSTKHLMIIWKYQSSIT